ncbi:MAG: Rieske 2Fe-2S domain-containing protein [Litorilinea sp.]
MSEQVSQAALARVATVAELDRAGLLTVHVNGHTVALFRHADQVYAIDNRCPHMGFPLDRGTVKDGILTCHWHHARFDLASGGTFDQFADDVPAFPVTVRDGEIWIDTESGPDPLTHQADRLKVGLERDISLVIAKAVLTLMDGDPGDGTRAQGPFATGLEFGATYRRAGWGQGLTIHVCFMNLLPHLARGERPRALVHGLAAVARDSAGMAPRFPVRPLPEAAPDVPTLKRWLRRFIEVRDAEGAERCVISALRAGADHVQMADMLFAAVTDRRYIDVGHPADFTNKALEALDIAGWDYAEPVLTSLVTGYANAARMEESNAWRNPVDLIEILQAAFEELPQAWAAGQAADSAALPDFDALAQILLQDDPQATVDALLDALRRGYAGADLAAVVCYAAARRVAQFHTSNEFGDWDTALHTFTFANAMHQGMRRAPSPELLRGVFDAAMSVYLDRFLNMPAARLPEVGARASQNGAGVNGTGQSEAGLLEELATQLDRQQQVNPAALTVARYLHGSGAATDLTAQIGKLLLREDRDFHTIQCVEAAIRQWTLTDDPVRRSHFLIAAIRYLAAHSPTVRAQGQTYQIASRLHRGEELFTETE